MYDFVLLLLSSFPGCYAQTGTLGAGKVSKMMLSKNLNIILNQPKNFMTSHVLRTELFYIRKEKMKLWTFLQWGNKNKTASKISSDLSKNSPETNPEAPAKTRWDQSPTERASLSLQPESNQNIVSQQHSEHSSPPSAALGSESSCPCLRRSPPAPRTSSAPPCKEMASASWGVSHSVDHSQNRANRLRAPHTCRSPATSSSACGWGCSAAPTRWNTERRSSFWLGTPVPTNDTDQ